MLINKNRDAQNKLNKRLVNKKFKPNLLSVSLLHALFAVSLPMTTQAETVLGDSTSNITLTDDTAYVINSDTIINSIGGNGSETDASVVVNGLPGFTLTNNGTIKSIKGTESGVRINESGTLINEASGSISGNRGVYAYGPGDSRNIINHGDISSITSHGIYYNNANGTIDNYGTINAGDDVQSSATGILITNGSTITLNNHAGAEIHSGLNGTSFGTAVYLQSGSSNVINNDGLISGTHGAVRTSGEAALTLNNNGIIESIKRSGIELAGGNGNIINLNAGSVTGTTGIMVQSHNNTIVNASTVVGNNGTAINISGNNNQLVLNTNSQLVGDVISTGTDNSLTLLGSGTEDTNFVGNSTTSGFSSVAMSGDIWTLSGNINLIGSAADTLAINSGTLILEGTANQANNSGGTFIGTGATLQLGSNSVAGMVNGNIINDGTLVFNRSDELLINDADISGHGSVTKQNEGTLILTGNSSYTGGTLINAGALQVGDGTNGLITGNVVNNAQLVFNRSDDIDFSGDISGSGQVTQNGGGMLTLSGTHTHSGGTIISSGSLKVGNGGAEGSIAGDITNHGELIFDRGDDYSYANVISGNGNFIQQGNGRVFLDKSQTYTGTTDINNGALILTDNAQLESTAAVTVAEDALLGGYGGVNGDVTNDGVLAVAGSISGLSNTDAGTFLIGGNMNNGGEIYMGSERPGSQLIINGNYTGNDGLLTLSTMLSGSLDTDKLVVLGDTSGTTNVFVNAFNGNGSLVNNDIEIIQVGGQSNGQFMLANRVAYGAYEYGLQQGQADGNWYLTNGMGGDESENSGNGSESGGESGTGEGSGSGEGSGTGEGSQKPGLDYTGPTYRPEAGSYAANISAARTLFNLRLADREGQAENSSMWLRQVGGHTRSRDSSGQLRTTTNRYVVQGGGELFGSQFAANDRLGVGVMLGYGRANSHTDSDVSQYSSKGKVDGYNAGLYATWYQDANTQDGLYVDSWVSYSWLNATVNGEQLKSETYDINGFSTSLESGYRLPVYQSETSRVSITPQAQVNWSGLRAKDHTEFNGTRVQSGGDNNIQTRLGLKISRDSVIKQDSDSQFGVFAEANWLNNSNMANAKMDNVSIQQAGNRNVGELKLGAEAKLNKKLNLWTNVGQQLGNDGFSDTSVVVGAKYRF